MKFSLMKTKILDATCICSGEGVSVANNALVDVFMFVNVLLTDVRNDVMCFVSLLEVQCCS